MLLTHEAFSHAYLDAMRACGLDLFATDALAAGFYELTERLLIFDAHTNLTAVRDPLEIIVKHYADSLQVAAYIPQNAKVLDVGCGGGFPCLPLAIVRPDLTITALDSTAKKLVFVGETAQEMGLSVTTCAGRAEELAAVGRPMRETFDVVVARAVAALPVLAELCIPFVRRSGVFLAMKGARGELELAEAKGGILKLGGTVAGKHRVDLPPMSAFAEGGDPTPQERWIFRIEKTAPTPEKYPRIYGKIKKQPLT